MGVVGSLPSAPSPPPPPSSSSPPAANVDAAESTTSNDCPTSCQSINTDETDSSTNSSSDSTDRTAKKYTHRRKTPSSVTVMYGPINIKMRQSAAPTLATGRCSKFVPLHGEAAVKRELRRKRNREAAKKLKEKRTLIEDNLNEQIRACEAKQQDLLRTVEGLHAYKNYLESECRHAACPEERIVRSAFRRVGQRRSPLPANMPMRQESARVKEEPRSTSPQWQILFRI